LLVECGEITNPAQGSPAFLRAVSGEKNRQVLETQYGNRTAGDQHAAERVPDLRGSERKRHTLGSEVPMEIDRENSIRVLEHVLSLVAQECLTVFAVPLHGPVATGFESVLSGPNVRLVNDDVDVMEFTVREIPVKRNRQGEALECRKRYPAL